MSKEFAVISAFLDDEPFDPQELADALSDPGGRALLIDSISLRSLVQPQEPVPALKLPPPSAKPRWVVASAAAALVVGLVGGYLVADRRAATGAIEAPQPTRVVEAVPFTPAGGIR